MLKDLEVLGLLFFWRKMIYRAYNICLQKLKYKTVWRDWNVLGNGNLWPHTSSFWSSASIEETIWVFVFNIFLQQRSIRRGLSFTFQRWRGCCLPWYNVVDTLTGVLVLSCNKVSPVLKKVVEVKQWFQVKASILSTIIL
jgi:hypothetical protein